MRASRWTSSHEVAVGEGVVEFGDGVWREVEGVVVVREGREERLGRGLALVNFVRVSIVLLALKGAKMVGGVCRSCVILC